MAKKSDHSLSLRGEKLGVSASSVTEPFRREEMQAAGSLAYLGGE